MPKRPLKAALVLALVFIGALLWARQRDSFERVWFRVHHAHGAASCVAVLPKTQPWPLPVVIYFHGSGGGVLGSGNDFRNIAEMGIAAIGMDYCQTNEARFEAEFSALLDYVQRQRWADTNRIGWLGYSLGAQQQLGYVLKHPERSPALLARLGGGMVINSGVRGKSQAAAFSPDTTPTAETGTSRTRPDAAGGMGTSRPDPYVLIVHGKLDEVFPIAEAEALATKLRSEGVNVDLRVLPGQGHALGEDRAVLFRFFGEYFLTHMAGADALRSYRSVHLWETAAKPLWLYLVPALLACAWFAVRVRSHRGGDGLVPVSPRGGDGLVPVSPRGGDGLVPVSPRGGDGLVPVLERGHSCPPSPVSAPVVPSGGDAPLPGSQSSTLNPQLSTNRLLRRVIWTAAILLGLAAVGQASLHWVLPRLHATPRTLALARMVLIQPRERADFDHLAHEPAARQMSIGALVQHAHLANYNRQIVNWKIDDSLYREYVLSPQIGQADGAMNWRRTLWESFYPRIRNAPDAQTAAAAIARHLRERVTIATGADWPSTVTDIWRKQITNADGFSAIHVAALRACGIPARINPAGRPEFWTGTKWESGGATVGP